MASDNDIYRAVDLLMDRYGKSALVEAVRHTSTLRDCGDLQGYRVWKRIAAVIGGVDDRAPGAK